MFSVSLSFLGLGGSEGPIPIGRPFCIVLVSLSGTIWDSLGGPGPSQVGKKRAKGSQKRAAERAPEKDPPNAQLSSPP